MSYCHNSFNNIQHENSDITIALTPKLFSWDKKNCIVLL